MIPAGKAVTLSVEAIPKAESCRHKLGISNRSAEPVFPTQGPISKPVPVVKLTFSARVMLATTACAFAYDAVQFDTHCVVESALVPIRRNGGAKISHYNWARR